jgi:16S rRNA (cytosine1402-N4)-methyltransferase
MQLDQSKRGFSFSKEGPLDMRMDASEELTAKSVVNSWPEQKLGDLFRDMGEEPRWRQAAKAIVSWLKLYQREWADKKKESILQHLYSKL